MSSSNDSYESDSDTGTGMELASKAGETVAGVQSLKTLGRVLGTMELSLANAQHNEEQQPTPDLRNMDKLRSLLASHAKRICSAPTFDAAKSLNSLLKTSIDKRTTVEDTVSLYTLAPELEAERQKVSHASNMPIVPCVGVSLGIG